MLTVRTRDPIKAALLRMMIDAARALNDAEPNRTEPVNHEYVRGQAELICGTVGLSSDEYRDALTRAITHAAPITITREG